MALKKNTFKFFILIFLIPLIWYLGRFFRLDTASLEQFLKSFPLFYSGILFIILYCLLTFFIWFSKDIFRIIAALLFGAILSTLFIWIAEIINAILLFHLARYLGRGFVQKSLKAGHNKLDERLGKLNFLWIFLFRATPFVPFRFLDLGAGLTRISFMKYLTAVVLGSPLRIFWVQYVLSNVGTDVFNNPYAVTQFFITNKTLFFCSLMYLILVILVAFKIRR